MIAVRSGAPSGPWLAAALLALPLCVPLTLYPPSDVSHAVFRVAVCLGVAAGIGLPQGRLVRWGLGLWAVGIVVSVVAAPDPWRAVWSTHDRNEGAWQVSHYIGLTLIAAGAARRETLPRFVAVAAALAAAWGVAPLGWVNGRLAGSTGNPLFLAPLLLVGVWGAWRAGWRALAAVLALAALATGSKGVLVAGVAAAGVWLLHRAVGWVILTAGVVVAAGVWLAPVPDSGLIRLELGRVALQGIAAQPLGWGAEGYSLVWDRFWSGVMPTGEAWHDRAHSLLLDRAIEWGLVGVAGWFAVVVAAWRRAGLAERMAIAAYLGFGLTMFEMMWGAAGFAVLVGYTLRGVRVANGVLQWPERCTRLRGFTLRAFGAAMACVALVVGAAAIAQTRAASRAVDFPTMQRAIEMWSPVGGDLIEIYLRSPQTEETVAWASGRVELGGANATRQAMLLAIWDRRYCGVLRGVAPWRPDVIVLCGAAAGVENNR